MATTPNKAGEKAARAALARALRQRVLLWADTDKALSQLIGDALANIVKQLASAPTDYQQWVLPRLAAGVQQVADALQLRLASRSNLGVGQAWQLGLDLVDHSLEAASQAEWAAGLVPELGVTAAPLGGLGTPSGAQLRALQTVNTHQIAGATADMVNQVNRQLGQVVLGARTPHQAMQEVAKVLPDRTKNQVRGIVTTNLATAYNSASFQALKAQAARDPKLKKQWRRSGKLHSRWNHDLADGQVQAVDDPFVLVAAHKGEGATVKLMHPADPAAPVGEVIHCGCVALPWKEGWKMVTPGAKAFSVAEMKARQEAQARRDGKRLPARSKGAKPAKR
ncbi:hypothetical protein ACFJGW_00615 [Burkholderiaceae bacterium UC74_6]